MSSDKRDHAAPKIRRALNPLGFSAFPVVAPLTRRRVRPTFKLVLTVAEPGAAIARLDHEPVGAVMYQPPKLERFGTLRQLTAAPFSALGVSLSLASGSLPIGAGDCSPNVPVGDPSACGRS